MSHPSSETERVHRAPSWDATALAANHSDMPNSSASDSKPRIRQRRGSLSGAIELGAEVGVSKEMLMVRNGNLCHPEERSDEGSGLVVDRTDLGEAVLEPQWPRSLAALGMTQ